MKQPFPIVRVTFVPRIPMNDTRQSYYSMDFIEEDDKTYVVSVWIFLVICRDITE
jgi:hypothetical protein